MKDIKLILEGFIIGIGKIIPGVSGAMFAMMFGVYEKSLHIISNLKTELKKNFKFMLLLATSILLAIILGSNIIKYCLNKYYLATMFLFIGMMVAGIKPLFQNVKGEKIKFKNVLLAILIALLLAGISILDIGGKDVMLKQTPFVFIILIVCGFIDAAATIVPGICGTALLMILGYYNHVIGALSNVFNISNLEQNLFILIPFGIGMILGVIIVSKLMDYLFKHYHIETYYVIIAFAITSSILLLIEALNSSFTTQEFIISLFFFLIGFLISHSLEKLQS